ncbi:MAG: tRNA (N6-threonylcarbamoyladenosine(37)-N6)-methyltransferase TrmO [Lysobacterales bacterium]|jgi:tRNA-Thr(GGU) m(6)t(6)A37 methyltransferase TsaA
MNIEYEAIGIVRSPFREQEGTPIQPSRSDNAEGTVVIRKDLVECLDDLDGFSHVILLCHLHKTRKFRKKVIPYLDTEPRGLFATRAPSRPNPIGLSVVELLGIEGNVLRVRGLDLLDGTPVLDIKPYVGEFDECTEVRTGWLEEARKKTRVADDRFE